MNPFKTQLRRKTTRIYPHPREVDSKLDFDERMDESARCPDDEEQESPPEKNLTFGKAFLIVCLFHVILFLGVLAYTSGAFETKPASPPAANSAKGKLRENSSVLKAPLPPASQIESDGQFLSKDVSSRAEMEDISRHANSGKRNALPSSQSNWYIVREGDTLSRISRQTGVSVEAILEQNKLLNPDLIKVGQRLSISRDFKRNDMATAKAPEVGDERFAANEQKPAKPGSEKFSSRQSEQERNDNLRQLWAQSDKFLPESTGDWEVQTTDKKSIGASPGPQQPEIPQTGSHQAELTRDKRVEVATNNNSNRAQTTGSTLTQENGFDHIEKPSSYTLEGGDNLYSIARKLNVSYEDLRIANAISDPRNLLVGQTLKVP